MLTLLIPIALLALFVYSSIYYSSFPREKAAGYTLIRFDSDVYTDIRSFEAFRNLGRWEKIGRYTFYGHGEAKEEELKQLIASLLGLPPEKFSVSVKRPSGGTYDTFVIFQPEVHQDISRYEVLRSAADWVPYGRYAFRGFCTLRKEDLAELISLTLEIPRDTFQVTANTGNVSDAGPSF